MLAFTLSLANTGHRRHKSVRSAAHSARIASFHLYAEAPGPHQHLKALSHWLSFFLLLLNLRKSSYFSIPRKALTGSKPSPRWQRVLPSPPLYLRPPPMVFSNLSAHSPQRRRRQAIKKQPTTVPACIFMYEWTVSQAGSIMYTYGEYQYSKIWWSRDLNIKCLIWHIRENV